MRNSDEKEVLLKNLVLLETWFSNPNYKGMSNLQIIINVAQVFTYLQKLIQEPIK